MTEQGSKQIPKQDAEEAARVERLKVRLIGAAALIALLFLVASIVPSPGDKQKESTYVTLDLNPVGDQAEDISAAVAAELKREKELSRRSAPETQPPAIAPVTKEVQAKPERKPAIAEKPAPVTTVKKPPAEPVRSTPPAKVSGSWWVQVASLSDKERAESVLKDMKSRGYGGTIQVAEVGGVTRYRLRIGPYADRSASLAAQKKLAGEGYNGSALIQLE